MLFRSEIIFFKNLCGARIRSPAGTIILGHLGISPEARGAFDNAEEARSHEEKQSVTLDEAAICGREMEYR
jgi:hypothetical protein